MRRSILMATAVAAAFSLGSVAVAKPDRAPVYKVTRTVPLGSPERWDYVVYDSASHRVYVSHGDRVAVVDGRDGRMVGQIMGIAGGTHGFGISAATGKGYTDDGTAGVAVVFDLKTLKVLRRVKAAEDADAVAFDPSSGHIFVINGDSKTMTVIDPKTDAVVATIDGGGGLEYAVPGLNGKLYVNGAEKKEMLRVDTRTNKIDARWPIPGCTSPHGLAIDTAAHRLFVSCVNKVLTVVDTDSGGVVASVPIGAGTDAAAFDPKRKLIFSSNGMDGTISVIHQKDAATYVPVGEIKTAVTGRTMGIDPESGRLYVVAADIDPEAPLKPGPGGRPARPQPLAGTTKLLFLDPAR